MKKIFTIILILILCIPVNIFANGSIGSYYDLYAKVKNLDGAAVYDKNYNETTNKYEYSKKDFVIPYNSKVQILYDIVKIKDDYILFVLYNENEYYVKASDLENIEPYNKKENDDYEERVYYTTYDIELRSGLGFVYDVVGTIKKDKKIFVSYLEHNERWVYVDDDNASGYIFSTWYDDYCSYNGFLDSLGTKIGVNDFYYTGKYDEDKKLNYGDKVNVLYQGRCSYIAENQGKRFSIDGSLLGEKSEYSLMFGENAHVQLYNISGDEVDSSLILNNNTMYDVKFISYAGFDDGYNFFIEVDDYDYFVSCYDCYFEYDNIENFNGFSNFNLDDEFLLLDKLKTIILDRDMFYSFDFDESYNIMYEGNTVDVYKLSENKAGVLYYSPEYGFFEEATDNVDIEDDNENSNEKDDIEIRDDIIVPDGLSSLVYVRRCLYGTIALSTIMGVILFLVNRKKKNVEEKNNDLRYKGDDE